MVRQRQPFSRDEFGYPHADFGEEWSTLSAFVEGDVQGSRVWISELLDMTGAVERGDLASWEGTGNGYTLSVADGAFFLENVWNESEPVLRLTPAELREALEAWLAFLEASDEQQ